MQLVVPSKIDLKTLLPRTLNFWMYSDSFGVGSVIKLGTLKSLCLQVWKFLTKSVVSRGLVGEWKSNRSFFLRDTHHSLCGTSLFAFCRRDVLIEKHMRSWYPKTHTNFLPNIESHFQISKESFISS